MKTEHTKGPWDFYHDEKEKMISIAEQGFDRNDDSDDRSVCGIWGLNGQARSDAENFANARLIAAAPDLIVALEVAAFRLSAILDEGPDNTIELELKAIEAALKKARG